jgi:hypothetical protein
VEVNKKNFVNKGGGEENVKNKIKSKNKIKKRGLEDKN